MADQAAKYCSHCGFALEKSFCFCPKCGRDITKSTEKKVHFSLPNFNSFKSKKDAEKRSFDVRGKSAAKRNRVEETPVNIQVGVMDEKCSIKRGENLPFRVLPSSTPSIILTAALKKHADFNLRFSAGGTNDYTLVYKDGSEVVHVPGVSPPEDFTLRRYKEESGLGYARIILYLQRSCNDSSDSESDSLPPVTWSTSSTATSSTSTSSTAHHLSESRPGCSFEKDHGIECPTCFKRFAPTVIAEHADLCASWLVDSVDDDDDLLSAIDLSVDTEPVQTEALPSSADLTLRELIQQLQTNILAESIRINVRRKTLWQDFIKERKRKLQPNHSVKVVFMGEPAVDDGGPRREFFSDMLQLIHRRLFPNGLPSDSMLSLTAEEFKVAGEVMAMSILQGGPAPNFLSSEVYAFISKEQLSPNDNSDQKYKDAAVKLSDAKTDREVQALLLNDNILDILEKIGYRGVPQRETMSSARDIVRSICLKDQLSGILPQLMQLEEGLSVCGLLNSIQKHTETWKPVFTSGQKFNINADSFLDEAMVEYSFSQSLKSKEVDTYKAFCDVIQLLQDGGIDGLDMVDFIKWLTGTRSIPPLGFPKKYQVQFVHGCTPTCCCRPTASTCDLVLKLPVHITSEETMAAMVESALKDSIGFGFL